MRCEGLAPEFRIEIDAEYDGPHVDEVLAEEAEPQNPEQSGHRRAGDPGIRPPVDRGGGENQKPSIHAPAADAANAEVIGEERVARREDVGEAAKQRRGRLEHEPEKEEDSRVSRDDQDNRAFGRRPRRVARLAVCRISPRLRLPSNLALIRPGGGAVDEQFALDRLRDGFSLPPSVVEWVPKNICRDLSWRCRGLDLCARSGASRGSVASYHSRMLLGLLVYGYPTAVFSSRKLERATYNSLAFRFILANGHPDETLSRTSAALSRGDRSSLRSMLQLAREITLLKWDGRWTYRSTPTPVGTKASLGTPARSRRH